MSSISGDLVAKQLLSLSPEGTASSVFAPLMGGCFNVTLPTYTDGQQGKVQIDSRGRLLLGALSQLPSTAVLSDAFTNPTLTGIQTFPMGFNGTTWDRLQVDASKFLKVNVAASFPTGSNTIGSVKITDGTNTASIGTGTTKAILASLHDGTNLANITTSNSLKIDQTTVAGNAVAVAASGIVKIGVTDGTGTAITSTASALDINIKSGTVQPGNTANTTPWLMTINQGGNSAVVSATNALKIDGSAVTQPVSGTVTTISSFSTRSDTYTGTGAGVTINVSTAPTVAYALAVKGTGGPATSWDVRLEGSLDNVNFTQILQHTNVTGDGIIIWSGSILYPSLYFRSRVAGLNLGPAATNIVVTILGKV